MTKQEVLDWLKRQGIKVAEKAEDIEDEVVKKVEAFKKEQDTQTRRRMRFIWASISVITFIIGYWFGSL